MSRTAEFAGGAGADPSQQWTAGKRTFVYVPPGHPLNPHGTHALAVHVGDQYMGNMRWSDSGRVDWVGIDPNQHRRGHGKALWEAGQKLADTDPGVPRPVHSESQSDAGEAWSKKVGGEQLPAAPRPKLKFTIRDENGKTV